MARDTGPRCKKCILIGERLFLKGERCLSDRCPLHKYPTQEEKRKVSVYSVQLREKQKAKWIYGILERQFRNYFSQAAARDNPGEALLSLLERRLDNVVYRLGFALSRPQARQMVRHGGFRVNDRKVDIPSYLVKVGDLISPSEKIKEKVRSQLAGREIIPDWLSLDRENLTAKILRLPTEEDIKDVKINPKLIVEFYSK
jgi:small subunit ribosomal protein S4|uniref:Small ribosomal subunit protein uS4 n=1 Tax=candidate division WOR-3 bacterium TaxID=2052148 RepID=A0A7C3UNY3_UNCW3